MTYIINLLLHQFHLNNNLIVKVLINNSYNRLDRILILIRVIYLKDMGLMDLHIIDLNFYRLHRKRRI
jgi:hypothetical protein